MASLMIAESRPAVIACEGRPLMPMEGSAIGWAAPAAMKLAVRLKELLTRELRGEEVFLGMVI